MDTSDAFHPGDVPTGTFDSLIAKIRTGNEEAAEQLLQEYGPHIIRVIRRRMNPRLRERFDSQDFTQAVWASFFGNLSDVARFSKAHELVQFLSRMASNKVIDAGRRSRFRRETHMDDAGDQVEADRDNRLNISEPTPSQNAIAHERWYCLIQDETELDQQLLMLRRQGLTQAEISERLQISERQVRRVLSRISNKYQPKE